MGEVNAAVALVLDVIDNSNDVEFVEAAEAATVRKLISAACASISGI